MKSKIALVFSVLIISASLSYAHPPSDIEISYSHENEMLSLKYVHVTNDRGKHYIRKVEILRTEGEPKKLYYVRQEQTKDIVKDIPIKLDAEEIITVKIFCKKGGISKKDFVVSEAEDQDEESNITGG